MHGQHDIVDESIGQAARYASLTRYADDLEAQLANGEGDGEMAAEALAARAAADAILERVGLR